MVPLILALYEVYVGTTASGAMTHLTAAGNIMNMRGPNNVKSGAIWPLFKGIRNAEVIMLNQDHILSSSTKDE